MEPRKVHDGLDHVERGRSYHLGHYEVDFPDGSLVFQVFARICDELNCLCDNLHLDWKTEESTFSTWYDADRNFLDEHRKPVHKDMEGVFRIVEKTETFRERISRMLFLRRRQVLEESKRDGDSFQIRVPHEMLLDGFDTEKGRMGRLRAKMKGHQRAFPFSLELCGEESCFCYNMFLELQDHEETRSIMINPEDAWSPVKDTPDNRRFTTRIKTRAMGSEKFRNLLNYMRLERRLENYHRYVRGYSEMTNKS